MAHKFPKLACLAFITTQQYGACDKVVIYLCMNIPKPYFTFEIQNTNSLPKSDIEPTSSIASLNQKRKRQVTNWEKIFAKH